MGLSKKKSPSAATKPGKKSGKSLDWRVALLVAIIVVVVAALLMQTNNPGDAHDTILDWMRANGAYVHKGLKITSTLHAGAQVRGVITEKALARGTVIAKVPQKLWIGVDTMVPTTFQRISKYNGCELLEEGQRIEMLIATGIANERRKGKEAFFAPMLKMMPDADDVSESHPFAARSSILVDFGDLPIFRHLRAGYDADMTAMKSCFQEWIADKPGSVSLGVNNFSEVMVAWHAIKSRHTMDFHDSPTIPALFDLFNTGNSQETNLFHTQPEKGDMELIAKRDIPAGGEIINAYCADCDNEIMLSGWGIYMENNDHKLNRLLEFDCLSTWGADRPAEASADSLREVVLAALDVDGQREKGWRAPRCRKLSGEQPWIRCSLARYAWERCAAAWGYSDWEDKSPDNATESSKKEYMRIHATFGVDLADAGKLSEAVTHLQAAIEIYPKHVDLHKNLGIIYKAMGEPYRAITKFQDALKLKPEDVELETILGKMFTR